MTKTYCITDPHGMYDLFERALAWIVEDSAGEPHTVVFLGDYVDRGPDSRAILERLEQGCNEPHSRWVVLLGNHEIMMLVAMVNNGAAMENWFKNGGEATMKNYVLVDPDENGDGGMLDDEALKASLLFINDGMEHFYEDAHRVYVHAFVIDGKPLEEHTLDQLLWTRYTPATVHEGGYGSRHVVHGHTPHREAILMKGRTNLDTGAYHTGTLTVGVFDDDIAGGPVALAQIT